MTAKILVVSGSIRTGSYNRKLADVAQLTLARIGADVVRISIEDYPLPLVDEDLKKKSGVPENAMRLGRLIAAQDGVFIACPEYNGSIPPLVKNTIDWVSLIRQDADMPLKPWADRYVALGAASPGRLGGIRSLNHLRAVLVQLGAQVVSQQISVANAADAFADDGSLVDERTSAILGKTCQSLVDHCLRHGMRLDR